jgi:hypothetical protein
MIARYASRTTLRASRYQRSAISAPSSRGVISPSEKRILRRQRGRKEGASRSVSDELDVLKSVTAQLDGAGIPYMVTGSMAANFYTVPRMTRDIDLVIELSERDVDRITRLFQQEYYVDRDMVQRAVRDQTMFNMIHNALVVKVDCVVRKETDYCREEFARRRAVSIAGRQVFLVSPEDLILSKLDWAKESRSQMQLDDVRNLLRSVQGLDTAYLTRWADRLGLSSLYREVAA